MKVLKALGLVLFLSIVLIGNAQEDNKQTKYKNQVSIDLIDFVDNTVHIGYERLIGEHISVGLSVGLKGEEGLLRLSGLNTDRIKTGDVVYSGFKIIPEVRYYLNKTQQYSMDGFYFGAYFRYSKFTSDLDGSYINDSNEFFDLAFDADISIASVGFMIGYKLPVWNRFSIDFLIAGPGVGFHNYGIQNTEDLPDSFYDDLNEALDQYSLFDILDGDFRFSDTKGNADFLFPSFRYGIAVVYSF